MTKPTKVPDPATIEQIDFLNITLKPYWSYLLAIFLKSKEMVILRFGFHNYLWVGKDNFTEHITIVTQKYNFSQ